jgi:hypothetical protein
MNAAELQKRLKESDELIGILASSRKTSQKKMKPNNIQS